MNKGDAKIIGLDMKIGCTPVSKDYPDNIEFVLSSSSDLIRKTLADKTIWWDTESSKFQLFLSQEETYKLDVGKNNWQVRLIKDGTVVSTMIGTLVIGNVISKEVL